jgi:hypothetical protein
MNTSATRAALAATAASALLLLSACGGTDDTSGSGTAGSSSPTPSDSAAQTPGSSPSVRATEKPGPIIDVTIKGDSVTPSGDRVDAKVGEPVTLNVESDREGELHVHSTPEQELAYGVGRTKLQVIIKTPGVVDIEDHVADVVVVQLQVT